MDSSLYMLLWHPKEFYPHSMQRKRERVICWRIVQAKQTRLIFVEKKKKKTFIANQESF